MDHTRVPVIVGATRTPIGRYLGALSSLTAPQLGGIAIREALRRSGVPAERIQEVIMGNVLQGGVGQAPARQAMLAGGVPASVSAVTINKVCGSGLKSVMLAAQAIRAGDAEAIVAGGMESMSNAPHYVYGYRAGIKFGDQTMVDGMIRDGLWCATCNVHMGGHAEYTGGHSRRRMPGSSAPKSSRWKSRAGRARPSWTRTKGRAATPPRRRWARSSRRSVARAKPA